MMYHPKRGCYGPKKGTPIWSPAGEGSVYDGRVFRFDYRGYLKYGNRSWIRIKRNPRRKTKGEIRVAPKFQWWKQIPKFLPGLDSNAFDLYMQIMYASRVEPGFSGIEKIDSRVNTKDIHDVMLGIEAIPLWVNSYYALDESLISVADYSDRNFRFEVFSVRGSPELEEIKKAIEPITVVEEEYNNVYCIGVNATGGLETVSIGKIPIGSFRLQNYPEQVTSAFDSVVSDMESETPAGRLTLLAGPPGTGKSHFVRGIIQKAKATFMLMNVATIGSLNSPSTISYLSEMRKKDKRNGPIVFLIEDADQVLVRRENGNISGIAELLNFSDGIAGELLDIRILATTNAKQIDMDHAILRPGRMSQVVQFPLLTSAHAGEILKDLSGESFEWAEPVTLAEVYEKVGQKRNKIEGSRIYNSLDNSRPGAYV